VGVHAPEREARLEALTAREDPAKRRQGRSQRTGDLSKNATLTLTRLAWR
jgi:hypothetical protein